MAAQIQSAFEGDALAFLMSVYKDPSKPENVRIDAAKAAIRYERPPLAPVEQPQRDFVPIAERIEFDVRYGDRLTQLRREILGDNFPGSALITVTALAIPEAKVEIQGYAVIGSK